jgi:hypothetical protein
VGDELQEAEPNRFDQVTEIVWSKLWNRSLAQFVDRHAPPSFHLEPSL